MKPYSKIAAVAAALVSACPAAYAAGPPRLDAQLATSVNVAGLDMNKATDAALLKRRLHTAAVELCLRATDELAMGEQQAAFSQCVASATDQALKDASVVLSPGPAGTAQAFALR